jgi:hypothetical protein
MNSNEQILNNEKEEILSSQNSNISENLIQKNNNKKKRKNKKKQQIENEEISRNNFSKQKSLLSEIKSIPIPNTDEGKKELIKNLKLSLIEIDNLINLLVKKRDYFNEIINSIEKEFMKKEEQQKIEKRNQEKSNFLIQELLSIYIIKFYSCVLMRMT